MCVTSPESVPIFSVSTSLMGSDLLDSSETSPLKGKRQSSFFDRKKGKSETKLWNMIDKQTCNNLVQTCNDMKDRMDDHEFPTHD